MWDQGFSFYIFFNMFVDSLLIQLNQQTWTMADKYSSNLATTKKRLSLSIFMTIYPNSKEKKKLYLKVMFKIKNSFNSCQCLLVCVCYICVL